MRIEEIERSAAKNSPLPDWTTAPEMCLYLSLRALYNSWRRQEISRDAARCEKRKIIAQCERFEYDMTSALSVYKTYQENIVRGASLGSEIEKATDVTEIALKACEYIGIMVGDSDFLRRMKKKIMEEK